MLCLDGPAPFGLYRNRTDGKGVESWHGNLSRQLTEEERRDLERRIAQQRAEHEKEAAERAAEARDRAQEIWDNAQCAPADHPYLKRKKIAVHGLRVSEDGHLLFPMYDPDDQLANLQFVSDDGSKWFLKGGRAKGCYFRIPGKLGPVVLAEGVATGASIAEAVGCLVLVAFSAGNLEPVATAIRRELNNADAAIWKGHEEVAEAQGLEHARRETLVDIEIIIAADDDWKTKGNPGVMAALKAARAARARIAVPVFEERKNGDTDFNDLAVAHGADAVKRDIAAAPEPNDLMEKKLLADPYAAFATAWVKELAALKQNDLVRYEQLLAALKAKKVRVSQLDRAVKAVLVEAEAEDEGETEDVVVLYSHWVVEPWPEPVETAELLQAVTEQINKYVATLENRAIVPALWILFSYVHDGATHSPLLLVTSPEMDSGKSTLLGVVEFLARRALASVNISGPALFRSLAKWQPTIIVDEADTALVRNDDLKEAMNSGWTRGQGVIRCDPETHEPRLYSTFAPKAIGMKGKKLPDTTLSRAIVTAMKRKRPGEVVEDFDHLDNESFKTLRSKLLRWGADHGDVLRTAKPETPAGFYNRTAANWRPLLAIAELAGEEAAEAARSAALAIEGTADKSRASLGVMLLADLRELFDRLDVGMLLSRVIVKELTADEEKPWATYRRDKPLTQKQLANLLGDFQIISEEVHPDDDKHGKGYRRDRFEEAWARYLVGDDDETDETSNFSESGPKAESDPRFRANPTPAGTSGPFRSARETASARIETDDLSLRRSGSRGSADRISENGVEEKNSPSRPPFVYRQPDLAARRARAHQADVSETRSASRQPNKVRSE
jgi:putative DNA primase/helicase